MFGKVLIANRGEISVRIARACREMGIRSVAVYSDVDRGALHTIVADEAYHIGPTPAAESYLNIEKVIDVARRSGAEAVHPGYGFLAESATFARAVTEAAIVWIGPHPEAIVAMGSKVQSRRIMAKAGVPITPGTEKPVGSPEAVLEFAAEYGFPVAVKASAGGGGKGFAVAHDKTQAEAAYSRASREGEAYFGDGSVYLERYLPAPRHIEIQVFRDKHGNGVHLGERDCSIQRRHQKLVEECPSPALDPETREAMGRAAVAAADAVGYDSAGTVEFLLQRGEAGDEFFFLEMNTRVQVEHPVTEEVTGVDIVQTGIRIAAGEPLPIGQSDVSWRGHAIEVRVNAEDAANNFVPSPGAVVVYEEPGGPGVRVDSSLKGPGAVPESYDPLFAKLIVRGPDRKAALQRLRRALGEFRVEGIATTLPFFRAILDDEAFVSGDYTTGFVADRMEGLAIEAAPTEGHEAADERASREVEVEVDGRLFRVRVFGDEDAVAGRGAPRRSGRTTRRTAAAEGAIAAPMQGTIVKVLVEEGQTVAADEAVCLLEAMKMESEVRAKRAGRVLKVLVEAGQTVRPGEHLVVLE
ncbi:MAG: Biotin carboxylase of acetyl-CoA carboxylase / Biotin carboxyl carrier protein of acetyl-CoA carboxylase [uncultured Rubrobacteraceae bacterium]|uniref:biotin carboxylase n=1 Tax=uncultured Rubrobacteraceae bacterium TaxID=349277 RepID=A0A6J4PKQ3_9ACTN|nr:MAG: Biotin carboxylase of acetyl-CoA carboxylase / Biotin carboxyl carrier protein of acetyl-CoA carboxylase [uncultured Rubrobacteraceae bacterium]